MRRLWIQLGAASVLALAVIAAYSNSLHGPLVLDDAASLRENPSIFHLWPPWVPLSPPAGNGITVEGRPILNLSFAINYAISGLWLPGFHLTNLLIHLVSSLLVLGIARRILKQEAVAFAMALLWAVHPLQTESVTYIVQRAESLMGLFYLATLYGFIRAVGLGETQPPQALERRWLWLSGICCFLGMGTKEVMVSAPLVVLLLDRTLVAGSFREALTRRGRYYAGLLPGWILLGLLVAHSWGRGNTSGLGVGVGFIQYWKTQPYAIAHYLYLVAYPRRLVFDYGTPWITGITKGLILAYVLVVTLVVATIWGLFERSIEGLLGFWFFAVLAPTSLVPGNRQVMAEHRMYLALVPVVLSFGWILVTCRPSWKALGVVCALVVCAGFGYRTYARNRVYQSDLTLFADSAAKMPNNAFAQEGYGALLANAGRYWEAEPHLRRSIALVPIYPVAEQALSVALIGMGQNEEAELHLRKSITMAPQYGAPYGNLGAVYMKEGRIKEAIEALKKGVAMDPSLTDAHNNLGSAYAANGQLDLAVPEFEIAVDQAPANTSNRVNYARALVEAGRVSDGLKQFRIAVTHDLENPLAHVTFGAALVRTGHDPEAAKEYEVALRMIPRNPPVELAYGKVLFRLNRAGEAVEHLRLAVLGMPASADAHTDLAIALAKTGAIPEATNELNLALRLDPDFQAAKQALAALNSPR